jgi:hypothetical protein
MDAGDRCLLPPFEPEMYQHRVIPVPLNEKSIYSLYTFELTGTGLYQAFGYRGVVLMLSHSEQVNAK